MNVSKTKCLPIALRAASGPPADLRLLLHSCGDSLNTACDCQLIERVDQYKYLSVIIDAKLNWEPHDEPVSGFKRLVTAWLRMIGPDGAEALSPPLTVTNENNEIIAITNFTDTVINFHSLLSSVRHRL
ncbi:hypothetical protein J6590_079360 [Homalodisca vitripennis]|nr:hypothetical protein J6590_079360 [Homalodisca vitripennis]